MSLNSFRNGIGRMTEGPVGKGLLFLVGGVLVFSLVYSGLGNNLRGGPAPASGSGEDPNAVILTANGVDMTRQDFDQELQGKQEQMAMFGQKPSVAQAPFLDAQALDALTTNALLVAAAKKRGFSATDAEIQQDRLQIAQAQGIPQQLGLPVTASVKDIDAALAKRGQPRTLEDFLPDDAVRQQVLVRKLQASLMPTVTEQQARDSFKQYHTRHILIDNHKISDAQAQERGREILTKALQPGADFAALAKQYSDDPGTKNKGGDDGPINTLTDYVDEFKNAAFALKPGEVTKNLVKSQFGYFIIKLEDVKDTTPKDFDKKKDVYIANVRKQMSDAAGEKFFQQVKTDPANKVVVKDAQLRADQELMQGMGDPNKVKAAIADYQAALKATPKQETQQIASINVGLAMAYQQTRDLAHAAAAAQAAADLSHDAQLDMMLGHLYQQNNQTDKAVVAYQAASQQAWDNPGIHQALRQTFTQLKRPDLASNEDKWLKDYQKAHPPAPANGSFGGGPITLTPQQGHGKP